MTLIIIIIVSSFLAAYCNLIGFAIIGWNSEALIVDKNSSVANSFDTLVLNSSNEGVSVIIPFRNEESNLKILLTQYALHPYPDVLFEIILVNDHSDDNWINTLNNLNVPFIVVENEGEGKKSAILSGVKKAQYQTILTTDADCILHPNWIKSMLETKITTNAAMVFGGVKLLNNGSVLGQFQSIDYSAMASVGAGFANQRLPFLCSGANLMFDKNIYLSVIDKLRMDYLSGDDVFLLHAFYEKKLTIAFASNKQAIVASSAQNSLKNLINQRVRWGSKAVSYTNSTAIFVSIIVLACNASLAMSLFLLFRGGFLSYFIISVYLMKAIIDFVFIKITDNFWQLKCSVKALILSSLLYPFWILFIATLGFVSRGTWKGRK